MDFPASPTVNQNFAADVGHGSWTWNGKTWERGFYSAPLALTSVIPNEQWANYDFNQGVTITGTGFWPTSEVLWDGVPRAAIFVSDTQFTMIVNGITEPVPRDATVAVRHGGVTTPSHPYHFIPIPPTVPSVASVTPSSHNSFNTVTQFSVTGSNFEVNTILKINSGTALNYAYVNANTMTFQPVTDIPVGFWTVTAENVNGEGSGSGDLQIYP